MCGGDLGILPHPSCRDHGDIDVHMQAESPLSRNTTQQRGTSEGGTSHVKGEKPDCSGLKFSQSVRKVSGAWVIILPQGVRKW